jgi:hypothetical protein
MFGKPLATFGPSAALAAAKQERLLSRLRKLLEDLDTAERKAKPAARADVMAAMTYHHRSRRRAQRRAAP